jgi:hypothetical protein
VKGHGAHTKKHAGSTKHHTKASKHHPNHERHHKKTVHHHGAHPKHAHTVAKHAKHTKAAKWSPNLDVACCAAEALAASLRLTGRTVTGGDVLDLYWRTAGHEDAGATIEATIEAAARYGLAGVKVADARPADALLTGVIVGTALAERHAMVVDGHGVWTWGVWRPVTCSLLAGVDEAWEVTWG